MPFDGISVGFLLIPSYIIYKIIVPLCTLYHILDVVYSFELNVSAYCRWLIETGITFFVEQIGSSNNLYNMFGAILSLGVSFLYIFTFIHLCIFSLRQSLVIYYMCAYNNFLTTDLSITV